MGGSQSQEFMVYTDAGEDLVASCAKCGYAANLEKATSKLDAVEELAPTGDGKPELVHTPGVKTIEDVAEFLRSRRRKYQDAGVHGGGDVEERSGSSRAAVVAFLRGDHMLNEAKLAGRGRRRRLRPMHAEEIAAVLRSAGGIPGADWAEASTKASRSASERFWWTRRCEGRKNLVAGANKQDYHLRTSRRDAISAGPVGRSRNVEAGEAVRNAVSR